METIRRPAQWENIAIILARLVLAVVFFIAFFSKVMNFGMIASVIEVAGFPFSTLLTILATIFELGLVLSLLTGAYFSEMMLLGTAYVLFLAFAFHGPSHWTDPQGLEFGSFISHFPFAAALLLAAARGPGRFVAIKRGLLGRDRAPHET